MAPITIIATALALGLIILFHEFGHFVLAKWSGMPVKEFSIGFGRPILLQIRRGDTRYCLRPWPLGGFVSIAGMEPGEEVEGGFDRQPLWKRIPVIAAGSLMNFVLAALIFVAMGLVFGQMVGVTNTVAKVLPGQPAAKIGLRSGDVIISANGVKGDAAAIRKVTTASPGKPVDLAVRRGGKVLHFAIVPAPKVEKSFESPKPGAERVYRERTIGLMGFTFRPITKPLGLWPSIKGGFTDTYLVTAGMIDMLHQTIIRRVPMEVGGPVRIVYEINEASKTGWQNFLQLAAFLSVNVGFINLLPFPALDGSRIMFLLVELVRRRPLNKRTEAVVHMVGLFILLALVFGITMSDINTLFIRHAGQ